jgi:hypothetical protein
MKLVDAHDKDLGNLKIESTLDPKILKSLFGLANYYHCFTQEFFKDIWTLLDFFENGYPRVE